MKIKILFAALGLILFCNWTIQQKVNIKDAEWVLGTWKMTTGSSNIYEEWIRVNNEEFSGKSYMLKEKDTIIFEAIRLVQQKDTLFYIPTVKNQNNGTPIPFSLKTGSTSQLIFENVQHDFPQIISYTKVNPDSLIAEISGTKNGQFRKQSFSMKRIR